MNKQTDVHTNYNSIVSIAVNIFVFFLGKYLVLSIQLLIFATVKRRKDLDKTTFLWDKLIINKDKTKYKNKRTNLQ